MPPPDLPWGVDLPVELSVRLACPPDVTPPDQLQIRERWPVPLRYVRGIGTPPATLETIEDEPGQAARVVEAQWLLDGPFDSPQRVAYHLQAGPWQGLDLAPGAKIAPSGGLLLPWLSQVSWAPATGGEILRHVPADLPPLHLGRGDALPACELGRRRLLSPTSVAVGDTLTVTLGVTASRCPMAADRLAAFVLIDAPSESQSVAPLRSSVRAWLTALEERRGVVGIGLGAESKLGSSMVGPTTELSLIDTRLSGLAAQPAAADRRPAKLAAAMAALPDWPGHERLLLWLTHATAPQLDPSTVAEARSDALRMGIELVVICVGGGCRADLAADHDPVDARALQQSAMDILDAHSGRPLRPRSLDLDDRVGGFARFVAGSARPSPESEDGGNLRWRDLPIGAGETVTVSYRVRTLLDGRLPLGPGGEALLRHEGGGRSRARLPRGEMDVRAAAGPPAACSARADKRAGKSRISLGDSVELRLQLGLDCPGGSDAPFELVLAVDVSSSMGGARWPQVHAAVLEMLAVLEPELDRGRGRVGLVLFAESPRVQLPPSNDLAPLRAALSDVEAIGETNIGVALETAGRMLEAPPEGARPAVLLLSDGYDGLGPDVLLDAAEGLRLAGRRLYTLCFGASCSPALAAAATTPRDAWIAEDGPALATSLSALAGALRARLPSDLRLVDELPPDVALVAGSVDPPPTTMLTSSMGTTLTWQVADPSGALTSGWRYRLEPLREGEVDLALRAEATWRDPTAGEGRARFPVPSVVVSPPDPRGPCSVEASAEADPSRIRAGEVATATWQVSLDCGSGVRPADLVLAIDRSASMGALGRLEAARAAADAFLSALDEAGGPPRRVGVVAFSDEAVAVAPLDSDRAAARAALAGLRAEGGTNLAAAIEAARSMLDGRAPGAEAALLLLTDGETAAGTAAAALAAAQRLSSTGAEVATVCAGRCDATLEALASRPSLAFSAADNERLIELYRDLAGLLAPTRARDLRLWLLPPADAEPVAGGVRPAARREAGAWLWAYDDQPEEEIEVSLAQRPAGAGRRPLAWSGRLSYAFGPGATGVLPLPLPLVEIEREGPDPQPPTIFLSYLPRLFNGPRR